MKNLLYILVILGLLLILCYIAIKHALNKIDFSLSVTKINLSGLSLKQFNLLGKSSFTITGKLIILNRNNFSITLKKLRAKVYYKGKLIAQSSEDDLNNIPLVILPNKISEFSEDLDIILSKDAVQMILDISTNKNPNIYYELSLDVFGHRVNISDTYEVVLIK